MTTLPSGWSLVTLMEVAADIGSIDPSATPSLAITYFDIGSIDSALGVVTASKLLAGSDAPSRARQPVQERDVLFSTVRPYLRAVAQVPRGTTNGVASTGFCVLRGECGVCSDYLFHFARSESFVKALEPLQRGTSYPAVRDSDVLGQLIPMAPCAEQHRIVEKLEELLCDLDAGVAELRAAQAKLKLYRQSLLKAAVTGELTAERRDQRRYAGEAPSETGVQLLERILVERRRRWGARQLERFAERGKQPPTDWKSKYAEPVALESADLPTLPAGWTWASLDQLCPDDIANGRSVPTANEGPLVLRLTAVREGRIDLAECKAGTWTREDARPYFVEDGDLLIVRGNGSLRLVGRAGLVKSPDREAAYPDTLIRVRVVSAVVSPEWVSLAWESAFVRTHLEGRARTSAGIYKISQPDILSTPIAVPPVAEQALALELFEESLSNTVGAEASLRTALRQSEAQRKNILHAAFSGQLVPQDPNDEPASVLLERIRASRAGKATAPTRRPRKARKPV